MNIALLDTSERIALAAIAVVFAVAVAILRRRPGAPAQAIVVGTIGAAACVGVLLIEQAIGLVVRASAPSTTDFNEFRWVLMAPWGRLGIAFGVLVVIAIVMLGWRASARAASPLARAAMVALRGAAAFCALIVFLEPAVELRQVAREPNRVAILVDDSGSMALREQPGGPTRAERAAALLARSSGAVASWQEKHDVDVYSFSDTLVPASLAGVGAIEPRGPATLVRQALEQTRARYDGKDLAGIVLVSDGIATGGFAEGAQDGASREFLQSLHTRVHTAWAARPGLKDVSVARVLADEFAFVRTVARIEAVVRSTGFGPRRIPVTLSSDGKALRQKWIDVPAGASETPVVFEFTPPRVGKYVYEIATPVAEDEAVDTNNRRSLVLRVIRDKLRVLQVAGQPSWDVRALRRMLKQNPNVDLISFFILRTHDDISRASNDELSLIPFPTRELFKEELPSFDLIVLQNFEYAPYGIGEYLENIRSYVEGGGGLVMLGGSLSFTSGGYADTPVAEALPVRLLPERSPRELLDTRLFTPQLTDNGKVHPITALRYETKDNLAAWKALPQLEGINVVGPPRPGATTLAVHPSVRGVDGRPMPVIVAGEYGDGRSLVVTTDSLWRWGFVAAAEPGDEGRHYDRLWENAIRWLIQDPEMRYLHVDSDAVEYAPGEPVRLDVRLLERDYTPARGGKVSLVVSRGADPDSVEPVEDTLLEVGDEGEASFEMSGLPPGVYRVRATATVGGRQTEAADIFLVGEGTREIDRPAGSEATLQAIAAATGGRYLGTATELPPDLPLDPPRILRVDRRADVELWSRPGLLVLALLLLGGEWLLRQRSGYL